MAERVRGRNEATKDFARILAQKKKNLDLKRTQAPAGAYWDFTLRGAHSFTREQLFHEMKQCYSDLEDYCEAILRANAK